jgi:thiamine kinase-like enzyme
MFKNILFRFLIHNHYLSLFSHQLTKENEHIVLTHNDINKQNILYKKKWLFFIDFEYSFKSTPYIDFATIYNLLNYNNIKYQKFLHFYYQNSLQKLPKDYLVKTKIYNNILVYTSFLWYCHMFVSTSKLKYKYLANKLSNKVFQIAKNQN